MNFNRIWLDDLLPVWFMATVFQTDPLVGCRWATCPLPSSHRFLLTLEVGGLRCDPSCHSLKALVISSSELFWIQHGLVVVGFQETCERVVFHQAVELPVPSGSTADQAAACSEGQGLLFRSPVRGCGWRYHAAELCCRRSCCYGKLLSVPSLFHLCFNVGLLQYCCGLNVPVYRCCAVQLNKHLKCRGFTMQRASITFGEISASRV